MEVKFINERPMVGEVHEAMNNLGLKSLLVQPVGEDEMILRFQNTDEETHQKVLAALKAINSDPSSNVNVEVETGESAINVESGGEGVELVDIGVENEKANLEELRFDSVGPSIGEELKRKSLYAVFLVLIAVVLYIAFTFRKVSKPIASWKYGVTAIIALFHDVIIVLGVFSFLGYFYEIEINTPFVAAILTVLGYSVNDTIVVFDRIRENLPKSDEDFEGTVNSSINQTLTRSIYTSFTTLLVLLSILFFGGSTIRDFVLALSIGIFIGTYSSIFLASPILVIWEKLKK